MQLFLSLETGLTKHIDVTLYLTEAYSHCNKRHSWLFGDTSLFFGFQILSDQKEIPSLDMRFLLGETFPTGKYENLNPHKYDSDSFGNGTYATTFLLVLAKTIYWAEAHPINLNLNLSYIVSSALKVHGFNTYGGGFGTKGTLKPGNQFIANFALEYSLTQNWVIGSDIHYSYQDPCSFSGQKGLLADHSVPSLSSLSSNQWSLAPCLEYNWDQNLSANIGSWLTVAGKNAFDFTSILGTVSYYF